MKPSSRRGVCGLQNLGNTCRNNLINVTYRSIRTVVEFIPLLQMGVIAIRCVMASIETSIVVTDCVQVIVNWLFTGLVLDVRPQIETFDREINEIANFLLLCYLRIR